MGYRISFVHGNYARQPRSASSPKRREFALFVLKIKFCFFGIMKHLYNFRSADSAKSYLNDDIISIAESILPNPLRSGYIKDNYIFVSFCSL